ALTVRDGRDVHPLASVLDELGSDRATVLATVAATPYLALRERAGVTEVLTVSPRATAAGFTLTVRDGEPVLSLPGRGGLLVLDGRQVQPFSGTRLQRFGGFLEALSATWLVEHGRGPD